MSAQKKEQCKIDLSKPYDDSTGITQRFHTTYPTSFDIDDGEPLTSRPDPVRIHKRETRRANFDTIKEEEVSPHDRPITPSVSARLHLEVPRDLSGRVTYPHLKSARYKRPALTDDITFCEFDVFRVPSPTILDSMAEVVKLETPPLSAARVMPGMPSYINSSVLFPPPPTTSRLEAHRPKSGIFINESERRVSVEVPEMIPKRTHAEKRRLRNAKKKAQVETVEELMSAMEKFYANDEDERSRWGYSRVEMEDRSTHVSDNLILGKMGEVLSMASSATSIQERELPAFEDVSWCEIPVISKLVQTLRDAQQQRPRRKYQKGALENHSGTKLIQRVNEEFSYTCISGSMHQDDISFMKLSRGKQGICMPATAFCYAQIFHPKSWNSRSIDEIVEIGNNLYLESMGELHMHRDKKQLTAAEINKYLIIRESKLRFEISDPVVKGQVRSTDNKIFNLLSGLRIFFLKFSACIFRTDDVNYLIWKQKKRRYGFFDATARKNNLFEDINGTAVYAYVKGLKSIVSILLTRTNLGNAPYNLSEIKISKILGKDEKELPPYISEQNTYAIIHERQAVVQGSFDLGDICFQFTRNRQALAMALVAITYSRLTPPNTWHKRTVDKILTVGNKIHSLCVESDGCPDVSLEQLPAVFTVGPYIVELRIYANRHADLMFKKGNCMLEQCLECFFQSNANAIAQIGKSFLAIWQQRGMFFCFDPYTRNKQGLKCRIGTACVTMNKDVETLVNTVVTNFENPDSIFYLHSVKVMKIQRDPELNRLFPRNLSLNEVPLDAFKKQKVKRSKRRAVEPITADFRKRALKKMLDADMEDILDVTSIIDSLGSNMVPPMDTKLARVPVAKTRAPEDDKIVDLDSPSLSDTQIIPKRPSPDPDCEVPIDDLDAYELTEEEKELEDNGEGEGHMVMVGKGEGEEEGKETEIWSKFGVAFSQVSSGELDPCFKTNFVNTDLTYCYKILPAQELPNKGPDDRELDIDEQDQKEEFIKLRNFCIVNPDMQIISARTNALAVAGAIDINTLVPYMCIMATAFAREIPLYKWERRTIDFVLKAGVDLYKQYMVSFLSIEDFKFEFDSETLFATVDLIFNTYIGDGLFDTFSGQQVLEQFLEMHIFNKEDCGFVIVPHYACAVFYKHNLFYLLEPFNCDKSGVTMESSKGGQSCLLRFKDLNKLINHLVHNLSTRVQENDKSGLEFRQLTLAKPVFSKTDPKAGDRADDAAKIDEDLLRKTQSMEMKRPSNFVDLPDGSQLVRGKKRVNDYGLDIEFMAPYMCVMTAAVGEKYAVRTWSGDVLDYILEAGHELYKNSKYRYEQLLHFEIPKFGLGHADYKIDSKYVFDAPMKMCILEPTMKKILSREREWAVIVTDIYSCAAFQRNNVMYLFDPYPCNELGLDDGPAGTTCLARFRNIHDLCIRILFNKNKREEPEKVDYTRFSLSVVKGSKVKPEIVKRKPVPKDAEPEDLDEMFGGEDDVGGDAAGDTSKSKKDDEEEPTNKIGYQQLGMFWILEGSKSMARSPPSQSSICTEHFVCLAACLMVINKPLRKWDTKTVNRSIDVGTMVFSHADDLSISRKRTIKNILVGKHFFDVIIKMLVIEDDKKNRNLIMALNYIMQKRKFCIIQFLEGTYVLYADPDEKAVHLFNSYGCTVRTDDGQDCNANACWMKFKDFNAARSFIKLENNIQSYLFYTFDVTNVSKAPKSVIITARIQEYIRLKQIQQEAIGKPFHEHESWMQLHQNPWSRIIEDDTILQRSKWYNWDIEYKEDLFLLVGTIHQTSREFPAANRGKQTLANAVMCIGMSGIYDLKEWNTQVIDAVLRNGNRYFRKCIEDIDIKNYEISMDDLLQDCDIFPYSFKIHIQPVIEGTMFLYNPKKFNLYKSLRYFFDEFYYRAGIIIVNRGKVKRVVAFGKRRENEYFMFDSQAFGPPMFAERRGAAYILRCTTLARLVHILVLTLRGGDFYIYEIIADSFKTMSEADKDESR